MTAAITNASGFEENPKAYPAAPTIIPFSEELATTEIDEIGDKVNLLSIPAGKEPIAVWIENEALDAHATPTLDMDLVISEDGESDEAGTETIVANCGTLFQTANAGKMFLISLGRKLKDNEDGNIVLRTKVVAAGATPAAGDVKGLLFLR